MSARATLFDVSYEGDMTTFSIRFPDGMASGRVDLTEAQFIEGEQVQVVNPLMVKGDGLTVRNEIKGIQIKRKMDPEFVARIES